MNARIRLLFCYPVRGPFQNLRAGLQTELEDALQLATHVVCSWLGNSPRVSGENTLVAEEGLELVVVFAGKSYILSAAGDKLGIISAREKR